MASVPVHWAVLMAKYLCSKGGAGREAYQMRQAPSGVRWMDWLVV